MTGHTDPLVELAELISKFGWAVRNVGSNPETGEAAFSYTVGLTAFDHPEVVVTGLPFDSATSFLNLAGSMVKDGQTLSVGRNAEFVDGGEVLLIEASDTRGLVAVEQIYGFFGALQLIWADSTGHFPWQAGYRNPASAQPILGPVPPYLLGEA